jgi:hypothetical protein
VRCWQWDKAHATVGPFLSVVGLKYYVEVGGLEVRENKLQTTVHPTLGPNGQPLSGALPSFYGGI